MRDQGPEAAQESSWVTSELLGFLRLYGYRQVDTPILEETDLLLRKSGGELASKMYTFTDPGGHRISLRPEFTSSVVRAYLNGMGAGDLPHRWSYAGPVFRYEFDQSVYRQFTQAGAELIGVAGPWADAEVVALACRGLARVGITRYRLVIGHLGFIGALLDSLGISDRARLFLLSSVSALSAGADGVREVRQRATDLGLIQTGGGQTPEREELPPEADSALLERYLRTASPAIGVRTPEEIRQRFLRKHRASQDAGRFSDALDLITRVVAVRGDPTAAVQEVRKLVDSQQAPQAHKELDDLSETLGGLAAYEVRDGVSVDFGLARGIAYYTGIVFEVGQEDEGAASLGGGGRYDGLVQGLSGNGSTPAMGFAWAVEQVVAAQSAARRTRDDQGSESVLVRPKGPSAVPAAVREAERLRAQGKVVELEAVLPSDQNADQEASAHARARGFSQVITVDDSGKVTQANVSEQR
jgi:histidyl-tRNA synthetase